MLMEMVQQIYSATIPMVTTGPSSLMEAEASRKISACTRPIGVSILAMDREPIGPTPMEMAKPICSVKTHR